MKRIVNKNIAVKAESKIAIFFGKVWNSIKMFFYNIQVWLFGMFRSKKQKTHRINRSKRSNLIFYSLMMLFPIAQFAVFYIGVNFNSFLLAFKHYEPDNITYKWTYFDNIIKVLKDFATDSLLREAVLNSVLFYIVSLVVGVSLALLFSYYIYKKLPMHGAFKIMLFLPSILSSVVMVIMFTYFADLAIPEFLKIFTKKHEMGLLENSSSTFGTIVFYNIWIGFGVSILMYVGAMNGISPSIVESAKIEGASFFQEFIHITLPMIYGTIVTFIVVGVAGIFTNQMNLYAFYGSQADTSLYTLGYYLFRKVQLAGNHTTEFPEIASMGLILTFVAVPLTLIVKKTLEKFGPKV